MTVSNKGKRKVFNSDDYNRGFADGRKDAEEGKDRDCVKAGFSLKYAINGSASLDSYIEGYNDGYKEAIRKSVPQKVIIENASHTTSISTSTPMKQVEHPKIEYQPQTNTRTAFINPINNQTLPSMDSAQRIELQLQALRALEQFLNSTIEELRTRMQTYNDRVSALRSEGLPHEIADNYDANYCIPNNQKLWQLTEQMSAADLKFIRNNIEAFEDLLERAKLNYNN
ncbi:MAG: hypothetical protein IJM33_01370 [Bacteroidales bacterium]|nr:hypothetical protein [Bacteroidales bacterium]